LTAGLRWLVQKCLGDFFWTQRIYFLMNTLRSVLAEMYQFSNAQYPIFAAQI